MPAALVLLPLLAACAAFALRSNALRLGLLIGVAWVHAGTVLSCWMSPPATMFAGWLGLDALGLLFLSLVSVLFLAAALYSLGYFRNEGERSNRVFTGCLLAFLASMGLVTLSRNLGLLWVAIEATTLASAPLIYFHRSQRALEATWKYLLICSVGIALGLLGTFFVAIAGAPSGGGQIPLGMDALLAHAVHLNPAWLKLAFLFSLVGYGTKMGLAPMHTWLPDAHSEAPSGVSALLSGALLNCAFLGILRILQICGPAGLGPFAQQLLVLFGLISLFVAAIFIVGQADYKRMLAYSSVEHMGILALGVGLGGQATYGAMLHAVSHSLTKASLFFAAGNIVWMYGTKLAVEVRGVLARAPLTGALFVGGFLAISGSPPFGPFLSEFTIFYAAITQGHLAIATLYLALLAAVFLGMGAIILPMVQGEPPGNLAPRTLHAMAWLGGVPLVLMLVVLALGLCVPTGLRAELLSAARLIGG